MYRPKFVTNSSSSAMIIWEKNPERFPDDAKVYGNAWCPHCGHQIIAGTPDCELDQYIDSDDVRIRDIIARKMAAGCTIFYKIDYMCTFPEDEVEHGDDESGWYSFQC